MAATSPKKPTISLDKFLTLTKTLQTLDLSNDIYQKLVHETALSGLLSPDLGNQRTPEENAEHAADKARETKAIYHGLRSHVDKAVVYDGMRENAKTVPEILDMIGVDRNRMTTALARHILESESTGWGLVGIVGQVRLYAKKAVLLTFRPRQSGPQQSDQQTNEANVG